MVHEHIRLLLRHFDKIEVASVREAYLYLTHHASSLREYECRPGVHGDVDDFRYERGTEWPFSFIVNKRSLLWYFRRAGLRHPGANLERLRKNFGEVKENTSGEFTVRIADLEDAQRIADIVFGRLAGSL